MGVAGCVTAYCRKTGPLLTAIRLVVNLVMGRIGCLLPLDIDFVVGGRRNLLQGYLAGGFLGCR